MKSGLLGLFLTIGIAVVAGLPVGATSLTIQPLQYNVTLKASERQKGFVDITNPNPQSVTVTTSVQAFRQIDDKGSLQFYTNAAVSAGITPDLDEFDLGPRETLRLYFIVDGTKLPTGDVFAALFATIRPPEGTEPSGSRQTVRVGTILSIVNGTPGARQAAITDLSLDFFQFDTHVAGTYTVKNTADPTKTTGFYPAVTVSVNPFQLQQEVPSKLVYAGHARQNPFSLTTERFGLYKVTARFGDSSQSRWVFIASGVWLRAALGGCLALIVAAGWLVYRHRGQKRRQKHT